jgi:hypothetical protein
MILGFHLITGQDIVAEYSILPVTPREYCLTKPAIIVAGHPQSPGGPPSLGIADFLPLSDDKKITISTDKIVFTFKPLTDIQNAYSRMFGSGLLIPSQQSIMGLSSGA